MYLYLCRWSGMYYTTLLHYPLHFWPPPPCDFDSDFFFGVGRALREMRVLFVRRWQGYHILLIDRIYIYILLISLSNGLPSRSRSRSRSRGRTCSNGYSFDTTGTFSHVSGMNILNIQKRIDLVCIYDSWYRRTILDSRGIWNKIVITMRIRII